MLFVVSSLSIYSETEITCIIDGHPAHKPLVGDSRCGLDMDKCCVAKGNSSIDPINPNHYIIGERINVFVHDDPSDPGKGTGYISALVDEEFELSIVGPNVLDYISEDGQTGSYTDYDQWQTDIESSN